MSDLMIPSSSSLPVPAARVPIAIRPAVLSDVPFMDSLQRMHTKMVGFMPTAQFEGNIEAGRVLIAVGATHASPAAGGGDAGVAATGEPLGYCIGVDRYFKRDDVGIIYQMNVLPGRQRSLVGAMLLKEQFERSAYGCKLYCCWCAQDIAANKFWEAMGFVPLAFRTGSASKSRIHIFWQKRIRRGDVETPWWFPSETSGGAVRENRLVLPIMPGTHWSEAKPIVLPSSVVSDQLPIVKEKKPKREVKPVAKALVINKYDISIGGLRFAPAVSAAVVEAPVKKEKKPKVKNDPQLVAAARELKDRWLEQVNSGLYLPVANGKYEVTRGIGQRSEIQGGDGLQLPDVPSRQLVAA